MPEIVSLHSDYAAWLAELKTRIHNTQQRATQAVNRELVLLYYMRSFAEAWPDESIVQEALAQLPWYHQLALLDKLNTAEERRWYAAKAIQYNWSRNVLVMQIETRLLSGQIDVEAIAS